MMGNRMTELFDRLRPGEILTVSIMRQHPVLKDSATFHLSDGVRFYERSFEVETLRMIGAEFPAYESNLIALLQRKVDTP